MVEICYIGYLEHAIFKNEVKVDPATSVLLVISWPEK